MSNIGTIQTEVSNMHYINMQRKNIFGKLIEEKRTSMPNTRNPVSNGRGRRPHVLHGLRTNIIMYYNVIFIHTYDVNP